MDEIDRQTLDALDWNSLPVGANPERDVPVGKDELGRQQYKTAGGRVYTISMTSQDKEFETAPNTWDRAGKVAGGLVDDTLEAFKSGVTAPARALQGEPVTNAEAMNTAGMAMTGSLGAPVPADALRTFGGFRAKQAPINDMVKARLQSERGGDPQKVFEDTNSFIGADGKVRFEIIDDNMKFDPAPLRVAKKVTPDGAIPSFGKPTYLRDVVDHPELFANYPELADLEIVQNPNYTGRNGAARFAENAIELNSALRPAELERVVLHEIQHWIQLKEKFVNGTNPDWVRDDMLPKYIQEQEGLAADVLDQVGIPFDDLAKLSEPEQRAVIKGVAEMVGGKAADHIESWLLLTKVTKDPTLANNLSHQLYEDLMGEVESRNVESRYKATPTFPWYDDRNFVTSGARRVPTHGERNYSNDPFNTSGINPRFSVDYSTGLYSKIDPAYLVTRVPTDFLEKAFGTKSPAAQQVLALADKSKFTLMPRTNIDPKTYADGGLATKYSEGGDVMNKDPVSGNEVPPGSMPEEVRDDIDAKLSEGEYVIPADVVRYFGVAYFEKLRKKAKEGLGEMDAEGRIGGEEEDFPFGDEELEVENDAMGFAQGGIATTSEADLIKEQPLFNPTPWSYGKVPGIGTAASGTGTESKTYINKDGSRISILFINGQPVSNIPDGYVPDTDEGRKMFQQPNTGEQVANPVEQRDGGRETRESNDWDENSREIAPEENFFNMTEEQLLDVRQPNEKFGALGQVPGMIGMVGGLVNSAMVGESIADMRARAIAAEARGMTATAQRLTAMADEAFASAPNAVKMMANTFGGLTGENIAARHKTAFGTAVAPTGTPSATPAGTRTGGTPPTTAGTPATRNPQTPQANDDKERASPGARNVGGETAMGGKQVEVGGTKTSGAQSTNPGGFDRERGNWATGPMAKGGLVKKPDTAKKPRRKIKIAEK